MIKCAWTRFSYRHTGKNVDIIGTSSKQNTLISWTNLFSLESCTDYTQQLWASALNEQLVCLIFEFRSNSLRESYTNQITGGRVNRKISHRVYLLATVLSLNAQLTKYMVCKCTRSHDVL